MRIYLTLAGALAPLLAWGGEPALALRDAWVEPADAGGQTFLHALVVNTTSASLTVSAPASPVAEAVRLQQYQRGEKGFLMAVPLAAFVVPPATARVVVPGGLEIGFAGLKSELAEGTEIPLTLAIEGTVRTYRIPVGPPASPQTPEKAKP